MLKVCIAIATMIVPFAFGQNQPSQFAIARHTFFDFGPPNDFYELFLIRSADSGATVEKITLVPPTDSCFQPAKVEVAQASLHQTVSELLGKTDPCKIPEKELRREKKRCKKCLVFSGANVSMLAHCGTQSRTIRADILDRDMFDPGAHTPEHTSWTMKLLSQLDQAVGPSVMDRPAFPTFEEEGKSHPVPESETLHEIGSGKYDDLFAGAPDKPSDLYRGAQSTPVVPSVRLVNSTPFYPENFIQPDFPPIAKLAHADGTVAFTVNVTSDGSAADFRVEGGSKLFFGVTEKAVNKWRFSPDAAGQTIHAVLEFITNCPAKR
jgi:hypothetical protein